MPTLEESCDVLVVGGGNAGYCAAIAAAQKNAGRVVLIDKCPPYEPGGNTYYTAGAYRTVHDGLHDLLQLVNNVPHQMVPKIDLDPYTRDDFTKDMERMCLGQSNILLRHTLVTESRETIRWLKSQGVRFQLSFHRQSYRLGDRHKFWGGLHLSTANGGKGLVEDLNEAARKHGVKVFLSTSLSRLVEDPDTHRIIAAIVRHECHERRINARAIILAAGGFEANPRMRAQYLGPGWDMAKVRGTRFNTGECLEIAMRDARAKPTGHWSGCHAVAWDADAPPNWGDRIKTSGLTKSGYTLGLMVNANGERFVDEGEDLRNYTYAKFGRAILNQPGHIAFQIWDDVGVGLLKPEEYGDWVVQRIIAPTGGQLAAKLVESGLKNPQKFVETICEYNKAANKHYAEHGTRFNPAVKDGLSTQSSTKKLALPKSNWALPLEIGPFMAVKVTCGVTFTFGGLAVNPRTNRVISSNDDEEIEGLYCVGEMMGDLFYGNYPGGSGLTAGAVFGRRAGFAAAKFARQLKAKDATNGKAAAVNTAMEVD